MAQMLFFNIFFKNDPHLNVVRRTVFATLIYRSQTLSATYCPKNYFESPIEIKQVNN